MLRHRPFIVFIDPSFRPPSRNQEIAGQARDEGSIGSRSHTLIAATEPQSLSIQEIPGQARDEDYGIPDIGPSPRRTTLGRVGE